MQFHSIQLRSKSLYRIEICDDEFENYVGQFVEEISIFRWVRNCDQKGENFSFFFYSTFHFSSKTPFPLKFNKKSSILCADDIWLTVEDL